MRIVTRENDYVGPWIEEHGGGHYKASAQCIGLEKNGKLVAGVLYGGHNGASIYMHVAASGTNWLTRDFLWVCFDYPFVQLECKVIIGLVAEKNLKARKFDEHLGFKLTSRIPEGHPEGNLLIYTMRKQDCRFLKENRGQAKHSQFA